MRAIALSLCLATAGCTQLPASGGGPAAGDIAPGASQAYFNDYPDRLFFVAEELCDGPGQSVVKPNRNQVRCESLPNPESAAALILRYDGTVEALPKLIIDFSGRDTELGYLMTVDNYILVPQRNGGAQQIRFEDQQISDNLQELLRNAGGRPL